MSAPRRAESTNDAARSGSQHPQGAGRGAVSLAPPPSGIALAEQGPSPVVQAAGARPAAVQMMRPGVVPTQSFADDVTIRSDPDAKDVKDAVASFWGVTVVLPQRPTAGEIETLRVVHKGLKRVPKDDTIGNTEWLTLEISRNVATGLWNPNGTMTFPDFSRVGAADREWRDRTIIHEAGHGAEEDLGTARVQADFTEALAHWTVVDPATFRRNHPAQHAALSRLRAPPHEDPINRMPTARDPQDPAKLLVFTRCTNGMFASFPDETRRKAMRVSNYSLSAPREFFAEMYTEFYWDTGPEDFADPQFGNTAGRVDADWARWIRTNIHNKDGADQAVNPLTATPEMPAALAQAMAAALALGVHGAVQAKGGERGAGQLDVQRIAAGGTRGPAGALPHLGAIQRSFGPAHDLSAVQAHVGGPDAEAATRSFGATAFATGDHIVFEGAPDLATAAHEAAHVVQQRAGVHLKDGVGSPGDAYERHADAVAGRVVQGQSAADLLDGPVR